MATKESVIDTESNDVEYDSLISVQYKKPNFLIAAKYKSQLKENQIMAMALANIHKAEEVEKGILRVTMKAAEIRKMINANSGSFYNQLNRIAVSMTSKSIGYNDPEKQKFEYIAVIIRASYEKGYFSIDFNPYIKDYLTDIKSNFTRLKLPIMLSFENVYSFRLYEFLRSYAYVPKNRQNEGKKPVYKFNTHFSLAELKLTLGVVNAELDSVKKILLESKNPNYEKAVQASPEQMYEVWADFKRYVLEPAVEEINEKSDIYVQFKQGCAGIGGKVEEVHFSVTLKDLQVETVKKLTTEEKDEILDKISDLIDPPLKMRDIRAIAEAAEYDFDLVKRAYAGTVESSTKIDNLTGFLISAIKDNYYPDIVIVDEKTVKKKGSTKKSDKNPFNNMMKNEYDFEALEKELLSN